mmetsp:Transcript_11317/g.25102  ORF Transcript_11317/g.25102 Transcript_11317/m.25102 type:complete len:293 (-) Transcript_11317:1130-2008(-)
MVLRDVFRGPETGGMRVVPELPETVRVKIPKQPPEHRRSRSVPLHHVVVTAAPLMRSMAGFPVGATEDTIGDDLLAALVRAGEGTAGVQIVEHRVVVAGEPPRGQGLHLMLHHRISQLAIRIGSADQWQKHAPLIARSDRYRRGCRSLPLCDQLPRSGREPQTGPVNHRPTRKSREPRVRQHGHPAAKGSKLGRCERRGAVRAKHTVGDQVGQSHIHELTLVQEHSGSVVACGGTEQLWNAELLQAAPDLGGALPLSGTAGLGRQNAVELVRLLQRLVPPLRLVHRTLHDAR